MAAVQGARSLGYGDITPQGHYPQAAAAFEAVIGVLYTVILLSRLVGMYVVCIPKSGPVFELVPASDMELRYGQESQA